MEFLAYCDKLAVESGRQVNDARRWKTVWNDSVVRRMSQLLMAQQITPADFLRRVSYVVQAGVNYGLHIQEDSDSEDSD